MGWIDDEELRMSAERYGKSRSSAGVTRELQGKGYFYSNKSTFNNSLLLIF